MPNIQTDDQHVFNVTIAFAARIVASSEGESKEFLEEEIKKGNIKPDTRAAVRLA